MNVTRGAGHTYARPGVKALTIVAVDAAGNRTVVRQRIRAR